MSLEKRPSWSLKRSPYAPHTKLQYTFGDRKNPVVPHTKLQYTFGDRKNTVKIET